MFSEVLQNVLGGGKRLASCCQMFSEVGRRFQMAAEISSDVYRCLQMFADVSRCHFPISKPLVKCFQMGFSDGTNVLGLHQCVDGLHIEFISKFTMNHRQFRKTALAVQEYKC